MNSYEYYEEIKKLYEISPCCGKPDEDCTLNIIQQCENLVIIASGELASFVDDEFSQKVCDILASKKDISLKLIFGDKVLAKKDSNGKLYNPLLKKIKEQFENKILNGDYELYYNQSDLFNKMADGYIHRIIIDGGKYMTIEQPHGYNGSPKEYLYFEKNYSIGTEECNNIENYIIMNCLEPIKSSEQLDNVQLISSEQLQNLKDINSKNEFENENIKRIDSILKSS